MRTLSTACIFWEGEARGNISAEAEDVTDVTVSVTCLDWRRLSDMSSWLMSGIRLTSSFIVATASDLWRLLFPSSLCSSGSSDGVRWRVARAMLRHFSHRPDFPTLDPPLVVMVTMLLPTNQLWLWPLDKRKSATGDLDQINRQNILWYKQNKAGAQETSQRMPIYVHLAYFTVHSTKTSLVNHNDFIFLRDNNILCLLSLLFICLLPVHTDFVACPAQNWFSHTCNPELH